MPYSIYIKSFTAAQKARSFLLKHNVKCSLSKTTSKGRGCGFALTVYNSGKAEVCALLKQIGVSCDIP